MDNTELDNTDVSFYGGRTCDECKFIGEFLGYRIYLCNKNKNIYATNEQRKDTVFEFYCGNNKCIFDCLSDLLIIYNNRNVYGEVINTQ